MNKAMIMSTLAGAILSANSAVVAANDDEASHQNNTVNSFSDMFEQSTHSGQIRLGYLTMNPDMSGENRLDDLAIGGQLKMETGSWNGFSMGLALYTSHSITDPDDDDFNDEMTSSDQHYDLLAEAYVDYTMQGLSLRVGRQLIDTPFADSDDIRMTPHTFEAVVGNYNMGAGFNLTTGWMSRWQGVDAGYPKDAGFDDMVRGSDGTFMLGVTYGSEKLEANIWYYNVVDVVNAFYADVSAPISLGDNVSLTLGAQISLQSDDTDTRTLAEIGAEMEGSLYGIMVELAVNNFTIGAAWDHVDMDKGEALFGGWGGGPFFTNIDTLVANEFAAGQDADSYTLSLGYDLAGLGVDGVNIGYTFGRYEGGADPLDTSADAEVEEHNFTVEYAISESWSVDAVYVLSDDKENSTDTEWDYDRFQVRATFSF